MGLDQELVREAERAKEQLAVAQHAAYRAKWINRAKRSLRRGRTTPPKGQHQREYAISRQEVREWRA
jgi:hypothetical protein